MIVAEVGATTKVRKKQYVPWLVGGDFNDILFANEKQGVILIEEARMEAFRQNLVLPVDGYRVLGTLVYLGKGAAFG